MRFLQPETLVSFWSTHITYRLGRSYTVLAMLLFLCLPTLPGCSLNSVGLDRFISPDSSSTTTADSDIGDAEADPELVEIDDLMCQDEELLALSNTGIWNTPAPQVSQQPYTAVTYDLPIVQNKQVSMYLELFQKSQRRQFKRWLSRLPIYQSLVLEELEKAGLPRDLTFLAMIESGFNPRAKSRSRAVGLWQFMRGTGRQYHLKIDKYVDERRDATKSTKAAVAYLSDLHREFGDWYLAVAAYNAGPGKIRYGLRKYKVDNFWDLASKRYLSLETKRYVPKLIATMLIAKNPDQYGFTGIKAQKPLSYETIKVGPGMNLQAIAMVSSSDLKTIKRLNLELRQNRTPLNIESYEVKIPEATADLAQKNMRRLHSIVSTGYRSHRVRRGDTLTSVCKRYNINRTTLLKVNNLRSAQLVAGKTLRIPYNRVSYRLLPEGKADAMAAYKDSLVLHKVVRGDSLSKISRQYQVPTELIVAWNGLKSKHSIRAGQQLALYIDHGGKHSKATAEKHPFPGTDILFAEKKKRFPAEEEDLFYWYRVRNGDSLWTISRKFSASPDDLKKWNNLKSNLIHPGNKLKVKKG